MELFFLIDEMYIHRNRWMIVLALDYCTLLFSINLPRLMRSLHMVEMFFFLFNRKQGFRDCFVCSK